MGTLILHTKDFVRIHELSSYNNNYYKNKSRGYTLLEKCDDDGDFYFYLIQDGKEIFIGCSQQIGLSNLDGELKIDFMYYYT